MNRTCMGKSEYRNPKSETNSNHQNPNVPEPTRLVSTMASVPGLLQSQRLCFPMRVLFAWATRTFSKCSTMAQATSNNCALRRHPENAHDPGGRDVRASLAMASGGGAAPGRANLSPAAARRAALGADLVHAGSVVRRGQAPGRGGRLL